MKKYIVGAIILGVAGLASLAFAEDNNPEVSHTPKPMVSHTPKPEITPTTEDRACMQNSIDKRDSAIISAVDKFSSSVKSALSTRKDALKAAWSKSTKIDIKLGLREAWHVYNKSIRDARRSLNADKKSAWSQYKTDSRACKSSVHDSVNEGVDAHL